MRARSAPPPVSSPAVRGYSPEMGPSLKLGHFPRYGELLWLLVAHRGVWRAGGPADGTGTHATEDPASEQDATALVRTLEEMGPTYVKLGQLLASRVDLLPPAYTDALGRLRDRAEELPTAVVRQVVEEELGGEVGGGLPALEPEPGGGPSPAPGDPAVPPGGGPGGVEGPGAGGPGRHAGRT